MSFFLSAIPILDAAISERSPCRRQCCWVLPSDYIGFFLQSISRGDSGNSSNKAQARRSGRCSWYAPCSPCCFHFIHTNPHLQTSPKPHGVMPLSVPSDSQKPSWTRTRRTISARKGEFVSELHPIWENNTNSFIEPTLNLFVSLIDHRLTFSSIVEEIPLRVRANPLLSSFLETLSTSSPVPTSDPDPSTATSTAALPPSFSALNLGSANVSRNLEQIVEALDAYKTEDGNLGYLQRQIAREKNRVEQYVTKRKEENASRVAAGLAPLPEEDVSRIFKIPPEPSRLESVLLLGRIDAFSKSLEEVSSTGLVKMYAAKANAGA